MTTLAQDPVVVSLDLAKAVAPAVIALLGVWAGSGLTRGRERRSWLRDRLLGVCSELVDATAAVEQWAVSAQFAGRLAAGQYPTEYKDDLARLRAAVAAVAISASPELAAAAGEMDQAVRGHVHTCAARQSARASGGPASGHDSVDLVASETRWAGARTAFIVASRRELDGVK